MSMLMSLIVVMILAAYRLPVGKAILNCSEFATINPLSLSPLQNAEARLRACFAANPYDTTQLPYPRTALPLVLQYDWSLYNLLSFDNSVLDVVYQLMLQWNDPLRQWSITELPVSYIEIPLKDIWYPRFYAFANKQKYIDINPADQIAHLLCNGDVLVGIASEIQSTCDINLWNFPYDTQTCEISYLGIRQFFGLNGMDLVFVKSPTTYRFKYFPNDEWEIISVQTNVTNISINQYNYYANGSLSQQPVLELNNIMNGFTVTIILKRFYNYYLVNVFAPIIGLSILDMLPFAIEDTAHEKLLCALTVVSGFMFVQGIVANLLPKSDITPNLSLYVSGALILSCASILAQGLCYYLCKFSGEPNRVVRIILLKGFGVLLYPSELVPLIKRCWEKVRNLKQSAQVSNSVTALGGPQTALNEATTSNDDNVSIVEMKTLTATEADHKERLHKPSPDAISTGSGVFESSESRHANSKTSHSVQWLRVAHVLNRLFALLNLATFVSLIAMFLIPIVVSQSTSPTKYLI